MRLARLLSLISFAVASWSGCGSDPAPASVSESPIDRRVRRSAERLEASEAGRRLLQTIEAHGGLRNWFEAGSLSFDYHYRQTVENGKEMRTRNRVDLWTGRARQDGLDSEVSLAWDGEEAWISPNADSFPLPARFWATTPYYFLAIPFVLADEGIRIAEDGNETIDGVDYARIRITYDSGVGDSSDDFYVLYLHPENHRVAAVRYIVSYPGFFPEGGHSPEKLMWYRDYEASGELIFPTNFASYAWSEEQLGAQLAEVSARNFTLGEPLEDSLFSRPERGVISPLTSP